MFSFERRHCSTNSDEGVQFKTAEAFSESAIFSQNKKKSYKKVIVVSILLSVAILVGSLSFLIHRLFAVNNINSNGQFHQNSKVSEGVDDDSSYSSEMTDKKEKMI